MSPYSYYPFTANALVLAVSIWLTFRYQRRFFTFWTLGFGFVQLTLVGDLLTMGERTVLGTAYCALTQCTAALFFFATAASVGPNGRLRGALLSGAALGASLGLVAAGFSPAVAFVPPSLVLSVAEICLGVRLLRGSPAAPTRWLAVPVLAKGLWILAFPFVTGRPTEPLGYAVDGLLLVLTGIGMIVYLLELHAGELQLLIDSNRNHAFLMLDLRSRIVRWNSGAERLFGYGAKEALFKDWSMLDGAPPVPPLDDLLASSSATPAPEATRLLRRKDGSTFWASLALSPVRSRTGALEAFALLVGDISERMRLQAERARLSAAVEQSTDSILIADPAGSIIYANRAFEQRQGGPAHAVLGHPLRSILDGEAAAEVERALQSAAPWGGRHHAGPEGRGPVEDLNLSPMHDDAGRVVNFVLSVRDVTREAALQNQLRHAQKMEELGKLASNVAHEFGNQLAIIVSYNYLLREAPAPKMLQKCTQAIDRAARRSDMLVRKLLLFTRQDVAKPCVFELNGLLKEIAVILKQLLGERVALDTRLSQNPFSVKMDPAQLEQVVFNLATNARDAMPNGGVLTLETTLLEVIKGGPEKRERFAVLSVVDSGTGMTAQVAANIFQPFYTTKPAGKGTGLGLSIVRTIIEEAGGRIEVASAPNAGSTFRIYLPLQKELPAESGAALARVAATGSETILVVEDEESLLESLCFLLEEHGYGALGARSAEEARSLFDSHGNEIDLLLADVILPKGNGRSLADSLVRENPRLRVLFMSAYSDDPIVREEMAQGRFISKPFGATHLLDAVSRALDAPAGAAARTPG